ARGALNDPAALKQVIRVRDRNVHANLSRLEGLAAPMVLVRLRSADDNGLLRWCEKQGLSKREATVFQELDAGHSNADIAARLFISTATARTHVDSIRRKLNVDSRLQAVARARIEVGEDELVGKRVREGSVAAPA